MLVELSLAIEERDPYTSGHSGRVAALAAAVARSLGWDEPRVAALDLAGRLHDVGKLVVPRALLAKPGPLDQRELELVRRHPVVGARLLAPIATLRAAVPAVLHHHERWDGRGYPAGLAGAAIPEAARLLAVADAFDAMTSARPYRRALTAAQAIAELTRNAGTQFDPTLVAAAVAVWSHHQAVA